MNEFQRLKKEYEDREERLIEVIKRAQKSANQEFEVMLLSLDSPVVLIPSFIKEMVKKNDKV